MTWGVLKLVKKKNTKRKKKGLGVVEVRGFYGSLGHADVSLRGGQR